jgi:hypothetical protein
VTVVVWRLAAIAATLLWAGVALSWPAVAQTGPSSPPLKWGPFIDLDGKAGTQRNIGTGDLFVPFLQNGTSMLFADIRGRFDDHSDNEGNFGLGVRHMLDSGWNVGAYGFYDHRKTELGSTFGQATFGLEALSLDWDFRANLYQPVGSSVRNVSSSSSTGSSSTNSSSAAITDTAIQVSTVTTTTNTTTTVTTQDVEQKGFDAEIGWRVPVFAAVDTTQLRVYGGFYRFYADNTNATQGPRGRIDLTIDQVPYLWEGARLELGTEVQNDGPRGTQAFAEARLRIPLQIFGQRPAELTAMERRMQDPVMRDVDIVDQSHTATASRSTTTSSTLVENATQTSSGSSLTFLNSTTTTGANLPTAVAAGNTVVVLNGTFNTTAATTLNAGQTLTAGTVTVKTPSGFAANVTTSATISASGVGGGAVVMANNSTVSKLTITSSAGGSVGNAGVEATNVTGVTVTGNTISATITSGGSNNTLGVEVLGTAAGSYAATITNNSITTTNNGSGAATALLLNTRNPSTSTITATVSGNTLNASGTSASNAVALITGAGTSVTVNTTSSTGNVKQTGVCTVTNSGTMSGSIGFTDGSTCPP